jgi:hypothetical protein
MTKKLAVTVAIDVDAPAVTLKPAGVLTDDNVKGLVAVVRRAERVMPDFRLRLDPVRLKAASPQALGILAEAGVEITAAPCLGDPHGSSQPPAGARLVA